VPASAVPFGIQDLPLMVAVEEPAPARQQTLSVA
jgi:hypothetical protein